MNNLSIIELNKVEFEILQNLIRCVNYPEKYKYDNLPIINLIVSSLAKYTSLLNSIHSIIKASTYDFKNKNYLVVGTVYYVLKEE